MNGPILPGECITTVRSIPNPIKDSTMTYFINRQSGRYNETVDEYEDKAEALKVLPKYQLNDHGRAFYSVSQVCRPNWKD
jgi:hypothetical protein